MGIRDRRGAGRGRAAADGRRFVALAAAVYVAAGLLATWPAIEHVHTHFLAATHPEFAEATPGDHLQTGWSLWLFGHQLEHAHAPWLDPYSFQPEVAPRVNFQGLVYGLPYWPLSALFGAVIAWNLFTLLTFVGAGGAACAWLRALAVPRGAALAGGLAFTLAPYRVAQSAGHLLGAVSLFLPVALLALEKRRAVLAAAAITAIPLSGQVNLALGAVPLFIAYAFVRGRGLRDVLPGTATAVIASELVQHFAIRGSLHEHGRSLAEVGRYSANWVGFASRHGSGETFVFLGWLTPLLAIAGFVLLLRARRYGLASLLAAAAVVPVVLALGTHLPAYRLARHVVPHLDLARVPERLLPISCLALAALAAFALSSWPSDKVSQGKKGLAVAAVLVFIAADLHVRLYHAARADEGNRAFAALRGAPAGGLLDLPVFLPDIHLNSTYLYYDMTAQRRRPTGYSTLAPRPAFRAARALRVLTCGTWPPNLARLDIRYVAVHGGLYGAFFPRCVDRARTALRAHGFRPLAADGEVTTWSRTS